MASAIDLPQTPVNKTDHKIDGYRAVPVAVNTKSSLAARHKTLVKRTRAIDLENNSLGDGKYEAQGIVPANNVKAMAINDELRSSQFVKR